MASSFSTDKPEPWQRFTVLDALLLQVGYALAFPLVFSPYRRDVLGSFDEGTLLVLLAAFCLGSILSGPVILASHWFFRGRRAWPSAGEWLWLSPIGLVLILALGVWALHWIAQLLPDPKEIRPVFFALLALIGFLAEIGCMVNALLVLVARSAGDLPKPPCSWTDWFGALTCLIIGTIILLGSLAVLS